MLILKPLRDKLQSKVWEYKFNGYSKTRNRWKFYHLDRGLIEMRDVIFYELVNMTNLIQEIKLIDKEL